MCITEQRSGQPSVIRYVADLLLPPTVFFIYVPSLTLFFRVFNINREDAAARKSPPYSIYGQALRC